MSDDKQAPIRSAWSDDLKDDTVITAPAVQQKQKANSSTPEDAPELIVKREEYRARYTRVGPERYPRTFTLQDKHVDTLDKLYRTLRRQRTGKSRPDLVEEAFEELFKKYRVELVE